MKRRISISILFLALLCFGTVHIYAQDSFAGHRQCICTISLSDLENFVIGGRSSLEMVIAKNEEDWFSCTTEAKGRNVFLFLNYSFESYEDYASKTEYLLGYAPITTYGNNKIPYAENFLPNELFGFLEDGFKKTNVLVEVELEDILHTEEDTMEIKGQSYKGTSALNTGAVELLQFSDIEVNTTLLEGVYNRNLRLYFEDNVDFQEEMQSRCEKSEAKLEVQDETRCSVSYSAASEKELVRKTMIILQTAVRVEHEKLYDSQDFVRIKTTEFIDISSIMETDASFSYELNLSEMEHVVSALPKKTEDTYSEKGDVVVRNNIISYHGDDGKVTYYYSRPFGYDKVSIITDLSKQFGRTKRTIEFRLDSSVAKEYHEGLKSRLEALLKRGDSLRIYEDARYYCYAVSYESWFTGDINRFTNRILEVNNSNLHLGKSAIPFVKSEIQDSLDLQHITIGIDTRTINLKYILPDNTKVNDMVEVYDEEKCLQLDAGVNYAKDMQYSCFYYVKLLIYVFGLLFLVLLSYLTIRKIRTRICAMGRWEKHKRNKNKETFCPVCGEKRNMGRAFCGRCGYEF